ncbi:unnamed protein product [Prorocentrum cordatum]|uniref:J domain-containing protein n=1 Tax=Prorocentrum cordatum TaxID=2364126 RepID=A0ABN9QJR9_9DINO|nr:unnamed protein product [Polarella glacialis]
MADVSNRDEAERCKEIARSALAAGDAEKAVRVLQKAKRMCPSDASIDGLIAQVQSGGSTGSSAAGCRGGDAHGAAAPEGMRQRPGAAGAASAVRSGKDGAYTADQARLVQRILRTKDYPAVLEVDRGASEDAVKRAYKKLALKLHPDKNSAPGAEEAFKKLSKVVQCLTDAEKREMYGRYGDEDRIPQQHRRHYEQDFMGPEDLFNAFFGGGLAPQRRGGQAGGQGGGGLQQGALFQAICMVVVILTMSSGLVGRDNSARRFSVSRSGQYRVERVTDTLAAASADPDQSGLGDAPPLHSSLESFDSR